MEVEYLEMGRKKQRERPSRGQGQGSSQSGLSVQEDTWLQGRLVRAELAKDLGLARIACLLFSIGDTSPQWNGYLVFLD